MDDLTLPPRLKLLCRDGPLEVTKRKFSRYHTSPSFVTLVTPRAQRRTRELKAVMVVSRGLRWDYRRQGIKRNRSVVRDIDMFGRSAYIRISMTAFQRHTDPMGWNDAPSRSKSPANPARNECGVTSATNVRALRSRMGKTIQSIRRSHACRCSRVVTASFFGRKMCLSPCCCIMSMCHCIIFAAASVRTSRNTLPSSSRTWYQPHARETWKRLELNAKLAPT